MFPLADYHMHTPLCLHAVDAPVEYARHAISIGLPEIGFSDHNPMPEEFDQWRMPDAELPRYIEWVEEARAAVAPFPVRIGLECDYIQGTEAWIEKLAKRHEWDYFIGSVHYLAPGWDVDNPKWIGKFTEQPVEEIWALYFQLLEKCVRSCLFDIIAHPDLVKKFGHRPAGDLRPYYEPVVKAAAETGIAMEVSTAGLRKPVGEIYPGTEFLRMCREADVPIVISSDAHAANEVGADFSQAIEYVRAAGYDSTVRFERRERRSVSLG